MKYVLKVPMKITLQCYIQGFHLICTLQLTEHAKKTSSRATAAQRVNDLMSASFNIEYMATHSLTGQLQGPGAKPAMDWEVMSEIISKKFVFKA